MTRKLTLNGFLKPSVCFKNSTYRFFFCVFLLLNLAQNQALAQNRRQATIPVSGVIKEKTTGQVLAGVSVRVKGGNAGTSTDNNGAFTIEAPAGGSLIIS